MEIFWNAQFLQSFRRSAQYSADTQRFHNICTPGNSMKLRYFMQCKIKQVKNCLFKIYKTLHSSDDMPHSKFAIANWHPFVLEQLLMWAQPPILLSPVLPSNFIVNVATPHTSEGWHVVLVTGSNTWLSDWIVDCIPWLQISWLSKGKHFQCHSFW